MKKVSTKIALELIQEAIKNGKSRQIEVDDSSENYLRMLISRYNTKNKTKITTKRAHGVYMEICAPFNRFFDNDEWREAFDLIQQVYQDSDFVLSEDQFTIVQKKLHSIEGICKKRSVINTETMELIEENDLLN